MVLDKQALLCAIGAYVPRFVLHQVIAQPEREMVGFEIRSHATLLFADVSGFTVMSENLARLGKEGAEELTRVLNAYFSTMITLVHYYGGAVIKFGGDAITCQFINGGDGLRCACACALEMQRQMAQLAAVETKGGVFNLQMKIGISAGPVLSMSVGQLQEGLEYVLAGHALDRMSEAEHHAAKGEILVDGNCLVASGTSWAAAGLVIAEQRDNFLRITDLVEAVVPVSEPELETLVVETTKLAQAIAKLAPYVPRTLYEQIIEGQRQLLGEHRWVVSLFVNFKGLDYDNDPSTGHKLQTYFITMQAIIHRYGGRLNRVITGDKGSLLHIIFGAPVAYEDNEERAIGCALEMQQVTLNSGDLPFITEQRIGIAGGYVFAGNVGSEERREYTVMGDVVNLSARLMQAAAPDEILMEQGIAQRVQQSFVCEVLPPIRVKGKSQPIAVNRAIGVQRAVKLWEAETVHARRRGTLMVGRQREVEQITHVIEKVRAGHGQLLVVSGEAGIGKSRLLKELLAMTENTGMHGFQGNSLSYGTQTPYLPWIDFFNAFFDLNSVADEDTAEKVRRVETQMLTTDPALKVWVPLVAQLLGLPLADNAITASLDAQLRKQRIFEIVLTLLQAHCRELRATTRSATTSLKEFFLVVFEDVHWMDAISLEMLNYVARNIGNYPILLVALQRPTIELSEWCRYDYYNRLELTDISSADALALIKYKLRMDIVPAALRERVLRGEARLNPYFVEEVINALVDRGYLLAIPDEHNEDYYVISGDLAEAEIPDSIQALVMSRIDRLDESSKLTVKVAASIGRTFTYPMLLGIYPITITPERLLGNLEKLDRIDLTPLDKPAPTLEYIFKHITTQEVAYESLLYKHRRELHYSIGHYLEQTHPHNLEEYYELLAYHYALSEDQAKGWVYLVQAGDKARDNYANEAAIEYYIQALTLTFEADVAYSVHESLGDVYRLIGQYELAVEQYRAALAHQPPQIMQVAAIRRKIAKTWERQGRYDQAMQHLDLTRETLVSAEYSGEMARVYNDMAWIAMQRGDYEQALSLCAQGEAMVEHIPESELHYRIQAELQHTVGSIYLRKGDHNESIRNFETSIEARQAIGDFYNMGRTYNNLAGVYWQRGEYKLAAQYINRSLEELSKVGYTHGEAMCYNNLGAVYYILGDYVEAIAYYKNSLEIREELGDLKGVADIYNNLGEVYQSLGDFKTARHYLQEAVELFTEIGDKRTLSDAYKLLAEVELASGHLDAAQHYCQQSLALAREINDREYEGRAFRVLGQIYRAAGKSAQAINELQGSIHILTEIGSRLELGRSFYELGYTFLMIERQPELAGEHLCQALQIFKDLGVEKELEKVTAALRDAGLAC